MSILVANKHIAKGHSKFVMNKWISRLNLWILRIPELLHIALSIGTLVVKGIAVIVDEHGWPCHAVVHNVSLLELLPGWDQ